MPLELNKPGLKRRIKWTASTLLLLTTLSLIPTDALARRASYNYWWSPTKTTYTKPKTTTTTTTTTTTPTATPTNTVPAADPPATTPTTPSTSFADEFSGSSLDKSKWMTTYPWGGRNNGGTGEIQYYADDVFSFNSGALNIGASKKAQSGYNYTSGMISSYGKFQQTYGKFEMRAKLPKGKGFWPAFWLLPTDLSWPPEIDIMEAVGITPNNISLTLHTPDGNGGDAGVGTYFVGPDYTADFHTYTVDWQPTSITWYVDGIQRYQVTKNIPNKPMYIIANLALGGGWATTPDATTPFPSNLQIDYIRAYPYVAK